MRGKQRRDEPMFACVRLEDLIPGDHILRQIDQAIDFRRIEELTRDLYSHTGRPSIDPEVLIRMMVVGYLKGITSERRLCEEVQLNLAYRWFCGLSLEDKVPDHSTFSKNRHGRFAESGVFRELFYDVVRQAVARGLVEGKHLSVDATTVVANASMESLEPIVVSMDAGTYLKQVEAENPVESREEEPPKINRKNATHRSRTDPDARIYRGRTGPAKLSYSHNVLMDNAQRVIVDVEVTQPQYAVEAAAAVEMVKRSRFRLGLEAQTIGGDKAYGTGEALRGFIEAGVEPHVPDPGRRSWKQEGIFDLKVFEHDPQTDEMICPAGKRMRKDMDVPEKNRTQYSARPRDCAGCRLKKQCTRGTRRVVNRHWDRPYVEQAARIRQTARYRTSLRQRQKVEHLFGEAKELMGLRRARRRRLLHVTEQSLMTAMVQNIKRIVAATHLDRPALIAEACAVVFDALRALLRQVLLAAGFRYPVTATCAT